jgi:flagellar protein FlaJ
MSEVYLWDLKEAIEKEVKIIQELVNLSQISERKNSGDKEMVESQIKKLEQVLKRTAEDVDGILEDMSIIRPMPTRIKEPVRQEQKPVEIKKETPKKYRYAGKSQSEAKLSELESSTLERLKKKKKKVVLHRDKKASKYIGFANKIFWNFSSKLNEKSMFTTLKRDLIKANLDYVSTSYISMILLTTLISLIASLGIFLFFMFFNLQTTSPFITSVKEVMSVHFLKVFWIFLVVPIATFFTIFFYPSVEKKYLENKINQELPFATIHMSAISGSMIEPSKMFGILISTKEYPYLEKEFTKIINEINVYGYDLVNALRNVAFNSPSLRLSELLNGLGTTINSGGSLQDFFDKRSQTLLLEYRLERESYTKTAETFMDIYISLVIAAPMILMLLLIMMSVSGLGIPLSTNMITLVISLGVGMINAIFLIVLQLKQPQT